MEVLVALVILAIAALIGAYQIGRTLKKARLDGAARDVGALLQRAQTEMKERGHRIFLRVEPNPAAGTFRNWRMTLWADDTPTLPYPSPVPATVDNGVLDDPGDTLIQTYDFPTDILLSTGENAVPLNGVASANWSDDSKNSNARYLSCDLLGRTMLPPVTGPPAIAARQITTPATLEMTQVDMTPLTSPSLSPPRKYELRIAPVWSGGLQISVYNGSTWSKL